MKNIKKQFMKNLEEYANEIAKNIGGEGVEFAVTYNTEDECKTLVSGRRNSDSYGKNEESVVVVDLGEEYWGETLDSYEVSIDEAANSSEFINVIEEELQRMFDEYLVMKEQEEEQNKIMEEMEW